MSDADHRGRVLWLFATVLARLERARPATLYLTLAALQAAIYLPLVAWRLADLDEGLYLYAARQVAEGRLPYLDFYYPQMYFLPYLYAAWMHLFGASWYGGRLLSTFLAIGLGLLVHREASRRTGSTAAGIVAVCLLATSSLAFGWFPLAKNLVLPTFLAFAAWSVIGSRSRWRWLWCGALVGLVIATRIYVGVIAPVLLFELFRSHRSTRDRAREAGLFLLGGGVTLLPALVFAALDPGKLYFNVVGSQLIRSASKTPSPSKSPARWPRATPRATR